MGAQTILMEWKALKEQLDSANLFDQENCWRMLKEHEEYMEQKGFKINFNNIVSPEGEIVWERH